MEGNFLGALDANPESIYNPESMNSRLQPEVARTALQDLLQQDVVLTTDVSRPPLVQAGYNPRDQSQPLDPNDVLVSRASVLCQHLQYPPSPRSQREQHHLLADQMIPRMVMKPFQREYFCYIVPNVGIFQVRISSHCSSLSAADSFLNFAQHPELLEFEIEFMTV